MTNNNKSVPLWVSLSIGTFIICFGFVLNPLARIFGEFLMAYAMIGVFILFLISFTWSLIYMFLSLKHDKHIIPSVLPLFINVLTALLVIFIPFNQIYYYFLFSKDLSDYEQVIEMIDIGEFYEMGQYWDLPDEWAYLSYSEEIVVKQHEKGFCVMFYIYRNVMLNSSGFAYCSNGLTPGQYDVGLGTGRSLGWEEGWYYVKS